MATEVAPIAVAEGLAAAASKSVEVADLPVIDLTAYMKWASGEDTTQEEIAKNECKKLADALHLYGCFVVKDPRVSEEDNDRFIDMMERYFEQTNFVDDARPEYHYQVGVTPEEVEKARNHCGRMAKLEPGHKALSLCPPEKDLKSRFFWRIGERPAETQFQQLNMEPVIPKGFPEWETTMNTWGHKLLGAIFQLAGMAALGFNLEADAFQRRLECGPHLLAPTGSNFYKHQTVGSVLAAYHYDLNFMTIHGKSRFPGLYIWLRDGRKCRVRVPDGCLLVQAGKQIEHLTGGYVLAGFHEVVISPETVDTINRRKAEDKSLWRVSSTLFSHIASDEVLRPLGHFLTEDSHKEFPDILTGHHVQKELEAINLAAKETTTP